MRIAYLSSADLGGDAANAIHVRHMCAALAEKHDVIVTALRGQTYARRDDTTAKYHAVPTPLPRLGPLSHPIFGLLAVDSVRHQRKPIDLWYGRHLYAVAVAAASGQPFAMELHAIHPRRTVRSLIAWTLRRPNLAACVVISGVLQQDVKAAFPYFDHSKLVIAHDAAPDFPQAEPSIKPRDGRCMVGYVGNLYPGKGVEVILELARRIPAVDFHVVGGSAIEVNHWRNRGVTKNLHFHGCVPHEAVASYLAAFDVVLLPNQESVFPAFGTTDIGRWTSPLKLFEYMSAGKAIVASRLPVLQEVLSDGHTALLAPPEEPQQWQLALERILGDERLKNRLQEAARAQFIARHSWNARADLILNFISRQAVK